MTISSMLLLLVLGLVMGFIFGFSLEKSRVFEPGVIVRQFELRNFLMAKVFLTAAATSLIVILIMTQFFGVHFHIKPTYFSANIIGGLITGIGIVLAGACPGTVYAQIGARYKDALLTFLGGLVGAIAFGYLKPSVLDPIFFSSKGEKIQLSDFFLVRYWVAAIILFFIFLFILFILEKHRHWKEEIGENYDGLD